MTEERQKTIGENQEFDKENLDNICDSALSVIKDGLENGELNLSTCEMAIDMIRDYVEEMIGDLYGTIEYFQRINMKFLDVAEDAKKLYDQYPPNSISDDYGEADLGTLDEEFDSDED